MSVSKIMPLDEAVQRFVQPGLHLHFSSTPSRSNAAVRAVCRRFRGTDPRFTLSSTGFHSTAHLLGRLRLGARYVACFFGDNYPTPRANSLYWRLTIEGADLEHWSLLSYVTALRAGALGHSHGVTTSILGSSLEPELVKRRRFAAVSNPHDPTRRIGLVAAMRPDVVFIHVPVADAEGCAIAPLPHGEGTWAALAATRGVILTAERIVPREVTARAPESIFLPPHRVLAVCEAPFGAHPQALFVPRGLDFPGYGDDFDAYEQMREVALDDMAHTALVDDVLLGSEETYQAHFDLVRRTPTLSSIPPPPSEMPRGEPSSAEQLVILAARRLMKLVRDRGYRVILAGVGHSFFAARMAKLLLEREGLDVDVLVETGMYGIECGPTSGSFLLGFNVIANARRLSSIEDALGAVTCGADNQCVGVIGAAQVDSHGNLNSTRLEDGSLLVGSGGANDIASTAAEVVVLSSSDSKRLVRAVPYITSPGRSVRHVVTEDGVLCRDLDEPLWRIEDAIAIEKASEAEQRRIEEAMARASDSPASSRRLGSMPPPSSKMAPPSSKVPISIEPRSEPLSWKELRSQRPARGADAQPGDEIPGGRLRRVCPWPIARHTASVAAPITNEERMLLLTLEHDRRARRRS